MRRFTLLTLIALAVLLGVAAWYQVHAATGPRRYPGPGVSATAPPPASTPTA